MQSRFVYGLKLLFSALAAAVLGAHSAAAQDEATNEQLTLELRQIRAEVDFLRNQLETGGGVADVRFEDLQRRIDKVLNDAAALATQASTAQRRAESAVRKVDQLEERVSILESGIDTLATRLARLEEDAVFAEPADEVASAAKESVPAASETPAASVTPTATSLNNSELATVQDRSIIDTDGIAVPLPKDRALVQAPSREVSQDVAVSDQGAVVLPVPKDPSPKLIAVAGSQPLQGDLPAFPEPRPEPPTRSISPQNLPQAEPTEPTPPVITSPGVAARDTVSFATAKQRFNAGAFQKAAADLQTLVDQNRLGTSEAEGFFLLGSAHQAQGQHASAIQAFALGLRRLPASEFAAPSLVKLADSLSNNGQKTEGCRLLSFVSLEYPTETQAITDASAKSVQLGC